VSAHSDVLLLLLCGGWVSLLTGAAAGADRLDCLSAASCGVHSSCQKTQKLKGKIKTSWFWETKIKQNTFKT
jgi:hypothetical protein